MYRLLQEKTSTMASAFSGFDSSFKELLLSDF